MAQTYLFKLSYNMMFKNITELDFFVYCYDYSK